MNYKELNGKALEAEYRAVLEAYSILKGKNLALNMSRGKPERTQGLLSLDMLNTSFSAADMKLGSVDMSSYGVLDGIEPAKELVAEIVGAPASWVSVWGNSSLEIMYMLMNWAYDFGENGCAPWCKQSGLKFLCPVPGYDRHFAIAEKFGFELIPLELGEDGPDMDEVEQYVQDPSVKGIWCVPLYANPSGTCYSDEVVKRFASLKPAASDFRIFWDNAYLVHHLYPDNPTKLTNILDEARALGNEDLIYEFFSTSKITLAGDGMAAVITSPRNLEWLRANMTLMTVGSDKINQLRHVRFLKNAEGVKEQMSKQAALLRPKFELVEAMFEKELESRCIASFTRPMGGYFISLYLWDACATRVAALCKEAGVQLTGAGAAYPYHKDPKDAHLRIAPSYPTLEEIEEACEVICVCVRLAALEKLMA